MNALHSKRSQQLARTPWRNPILEVKSRLFLLIIITYSSSLQFSLALIFFSQKPRFWFERHQNATWADESARHSGCTEVCFKYIFKTDHFSVFCQFPPPLCILPILFFRNSLDKTLERLTWCFVCWQEIYIIHRTGRAWLVVFIYIIYGRGRGCIVCKQACIVCRQACIVCR